MRNFIKSWWLTLVCLFGILLLAFVIRIYNLTILPVFADEAIYIRWSQIMGNEPTLRFLPLSDGKQPLFMWILMFVVSRISDPLFAGRILSVFAGLGTIIGLFSLTYYLFRNKKVALLASFFWAISPYAFFFDRMALVDSLLTMFVVCTAFLAAVTAKTKRLDMAMLTGFSLGFAALTKSPALFSFLLIPSSWIFASWSKKPKVILASLVKLSGLAGATYIIALAMYNIQRLGPNFNMLSSRTADYVFPISHLWTNPRDPFVFLIDRAIEWLRIMGPWPVLILVLIGLFSNLKKFWKGELFLLSWWAVPTLIQAMFAKVFTARYELYALPFLFVIASTSILTKNKILKTFVGGLILLFMILSARFNYDLLVSPEKANLPRSERSGYLEEWTAGTGIKEVADFIKEEQIKNPDQKIVIGTEGYFGTLPDGLQIYLQDTQNVTVIGVGLGISEVHPSLKESFEVGNKTYLVANSSRLNMKKDFSEYGLKVIKSFKKADRPLEGYKETVQFGPFDTFYLFEVQKTSEL